MNKVDIKDVVSIAEKAGEKILKIYSEDFDVKKKSDSSPLTEADLAAHYTIIDGLKKLDPSIPILSEESFDEVDTKERLSWKKYWLVDPLDGTKEFVNRNGEFTVNIALVDDYHVILGVVHVPVKMVTYFAEKGKGAFKKEKDKTIRISVNKKAEKPFTVVASRSHTGEKMQHFLEKIGEHKFIFTGSSIKGCLVAEGKADIYPRLSGSNEWDIAACHAVVEEAGGQVTGTDIKPFLYNKKEDITNPHILMFGDSTVDWSKYL